MSAVRHIVGVPSCRPARRAPGPASSRATLGLIGLSLALAVSLTACSSSSSDAKPATSSGSASGGVSGSFDGVTVTGVIGTQPNVAIGDSTQQTSSLQYKDVIVGSGPSASATDKVTVAYVARSAKTKRTFDSSWLRGKTFSYDPKNLTFRAFTDGVPGMKVCGRRLVIVPGPLAYGAAPPSWSGLGPNETLVFVIDLKSIDS